jgi:3',5'-cyclic AMP phosphodiesterase CpdA
MRRRTVLRGLLAGALSVTSLRHLAAGPVKGNLLPPLRIVFFTDVHTQPQEGIPEALQLAAAAMREIDADLILNGGDTIQGGIGLAEKECEPRFEMFRECLLRPLGRPVEHLIGNHDLAGAAPRDGSAPAKDPRRLVSESLGITEPYRICDVGGWRVVILDSVELTGGDPAYRGKISDLQMAWLRTQIDATPRETPILLATHIPFRTTFMQAKESPTTGLGENLVVSNANEVLALFAGRNLPIVLQGHLHSNEAINWAGRNFIMGGAICAGRWRGPNLDTGFGFGVLDVGNHGVDWKYRSYGWPVG